MNFQVGFPVALLWTALVTSGCADASAADRYTPADVVFRPSEQMEMGETGFVLDFDVSGGRLFLLEPDLVRIMIEQEGRWVQLARVGRAGAGPGEFRQPTSIAATPDGFIVAERDRIQQFDRNGQYVSAAMLDAPCAMMRPRIAAGASGLFLHGTCPRRGYGTDTVKAILAWSASGRDWSVVAEEVHYTTDGKIGSAFSSSTLFSGGLTHHLFGSGYYDCLWRVRENGSVPIAERTCDQVDRFYRSPPPPELEARLRSGTAPPGVGWPERLPAYLDRAVTGAGDVLVRPFTTDSVVLQLAGRGGAELAVMPLEGLIGCKLEGCLWVFAETDRLQWLDQYAFARLAGGPR